MKSHRVWEGKTALDLYCGAGLFSVPLARKFGKVVGVETNADSLRFARKNAAGARLHNVKFVKGRVFEFLKETKGEPADLVVVDPPRSGVKTKTLREISDACGKNLVYVSCNPSTLARDLKDLLEWGFKIESVKALDLFPQTHHVETVAKLVRV